MYVCGYNTFSISKVIKKKLEYNVTTREKRVGIHSLFHTINIDHMLICNVTVHVQNNCKDTLPL